MRGLSIDMAVFRDLLKLRLPRLSKHLDNLQFSETKEGSKGNQNYCIDIRWKKLNIWFSLMMKDCEWMLLFCRYKFWTSIDKCIYNAVVSDPVFNLPSKRYRITCMGPYSSRRKWNTIENGPCDLERVRGVSRIFHLYIHISDLENIKLCQISMITLNCIKQAYHSSSRYCRWILLRDGATVSGNAGIQTFWF